MPSILVAVTHPAANAAATAAAGVGIGVAVVVWIVLGSALYFLPTIIAFSRKKTNAVPILVLNFFLGWSLIGWVVSLVWALSAEQTQQPVIVHTTISAPAGYSPGPVYASRPGDVEVAQIVHDERGDS